MNNEVHSLSPALLSSFIVGYFLLLMVVAWFTSRGATNQSFFIGNKNSNWLLVAFGMVGTTLSGVTFVSVPGTVGTAGFAYFQVVLGNMIGFIAVAFILLPLYYKLNLTSIYTYLQLRLGKVSYKTGASFFILSRTLGATARLYLVVKILHDGILHQMGLPFWLTTLIILAMIIIYTIEGGVKTIVYTDTLQTTCILAGLVISVGYILHSLNLGIGDTFSIMADKGYSNIFNFDPQSRLFFLKQILGGALITVTMVGLDQEMMQKNISVKTLANSQKNMVTFSAIFVAGNFLFLFLGALLYIFADARGIAASGDKLFPVVALQHMPPLLSVIFIVALISALFPSADGAITALTSSTCIDILGMGSRTDWSDATKSKIRRGVHGGFAVLFFLCVMFFYWQDNPSMIDVILKVAGYTYGPLLGLFTFGMLTRRKLRESLVVWVALLSPVLCFLIDKYQQKLFPGFQIGLELLFINGLITFLGLLAISVRDDSKFQIPNSKS
jgi:Na+/proline symporter